MPITLVVLLLTVAVLAGVFAIVLARQAVRRSGSSLSTRWATSVAWTDALPMDATPGKLSRADDLPAILQQRFNASSAGNVDAVLQFRFSDPPPSEWQLAIRKGTCIVAPGSAAAPTTTITTSLTPWREIVRGKESIASAFLAGKFQAEGDLSLLWRLDGLFSSQPGRGPAAVVSSASGSLGDQAPMGRQEAADTGTHHFSLRERLGAVAMEAFMSTLDGQLAPSLSTEGRQGLIRQISELPPTLSPEERKRAILELVAPHLKNAGLGTVTVESLQVNLSPGAGAATDPSARIRAAVREALSALPPNASAEERAAAVRTVLDHLPGHPVIDVQWSKQVND